MKQLGRGGTLFVVVVIVSLNSRIPSDEGSGDIKAFVRVFSGVS